MCKVFLLFLIFNVGCVTTKRLSDSSVPLYLNSYFDSCDTLEGGLYLGFKNSDFELADMSFDWIESESSFRAELADPFGARLLEIKKNSLAGQVEFTGPLSSRVPKVEVSQGFLVLDGNKVGVLFEELKCFLNFKVPSAWKRFFVRKGIHKGNVQSKKGAENIERGSRVFEFYHEGRWIWISTNKNSNTICAKLKWTYYLGLVERKIRYCVTAGDSLRAEVDLGQYGKLFWTGQD